MVGRLQESSANRSGGFVTLLLLVSLPILISLLVIVWSSGCALIYYHRLQHLCRSELVKIQTDASLQLSRLVRLNPRAFRLRTEEVLARQALAVSSGNAVAYAAALANHRRIVAQQMALAATQQSHYWSARKTIVLGRLRLQRLIHQDAHWFDRFGSQIDHRGMVSVSILGGHLSIFKTPLASLTPDYKLAPSFSLLQALIVRWQIGVANVIPNWMRSYLAGVSDLQGECSATIQAKDERSEKWRVTLGAGRSSLNSY